MSQRNKNNSIVFLTTLSVYIGLVLVGGVTPSVLAQVSKTQQCDFREFENKSRIAFAKIGIDYSKVPDLANQLKTFVLSGNNFYEEGTKFLDYDFIIEITADGKTKISTTSVLPTSKGIGQRITPTSEFGEDIFPLVENLALTFKYVLRKESFNANYKISFDENEFVSAFKFQLDNDTNSKNFADGYNLLNQTMVCLAEGGAKNIGEVLQENTKATFENNQVFIVTRLPRGSLDELFKQDAKAENQ